MNDANESSVSVTFRKMAPTTYGRTLPVYAVTDHIMVCQYDLSIGMFIVRYVPLFFE